MDFIQFGTRLSQLIGVVAVFSVVIENLTQILDHAYNTSLRDQLFSSYGRTRIHNTINTLPSPTIPPAVTVTTAAKVTATETAISLRQITTIFTKTVDVGPVQTVYTNAPEEVLVSPNEAFQQLVLWDWLHVLSYFAYSVLALFIFHRFFRKYFEAKKLKFYGPIQDPASGRWMFSDPSPASEPQADQGQHIRDILDAAQQNGIFEGIIAQASQEAARIVLDGLEEPISSMAADTAALRRVFEPRFQNKSGQPYPDTAYQGQVTKALRTFINIPEGNADEESSDQDSDRMPQPETPDFSVSTIHKDFLASLAGHHQPSDLERESYVLKRIIDQIRKNVIDASKLENCPGEGHAEFIKFARQKADTDASTYDEAFFRQHTATRSAGSPARAGEWTLENIVEAIKQTIDTVALAKPHQHASCPEAERPDLNPEHKVGPAKQVRLQSPKPYRNPIFQPSRRGNTLERQELLNSERSRRALLTETTAFLNDLYKNLEEQESHMMIVEQYDSQYPNAFILCYLSQKHEAEYRTLKQDLEEFFDELLVEDRLEDSPPAAQHGQYMIMKNRHDKLLERLLRIKNCYVECVPEETEADSGIRINVPSQSAFQSLLDKTGIETSLPKSGDISSFQDQLAVSDSPPVRTRNETKAQSARDISYSHDPPTILEAPLPHKDGVRPSEIPATPQKAPGNKETPTFLGSGPFAPITSGLSTTPAGTPPYASFPIAGDDSSEISSTYEEICPSKREREESLRIQQELEERITQEAEAQRKREAEQKRQDEEEKQRERAERERRRQKLEERQRRKDDEQRHRAAEEDRRRETERQRQHEEEKQRQQDAEEQKRSAEEEQRHRYAEEQALLLRHAEDQANAACLEREEQQLIEQEANSKQADANAEAIQRQIEEQKQQYNEEQRLEQVERKAANRAAEEQKRLEEERAQMIETAAQTTNEYIHTQLDQNLFANISLQGISDGKSGRNDRWTEDDAYLFGGMDQDSPNPLEGMVDFLKNGGCGTAADTSDDHLMQDTAFDKDNLEDVDEMSFSPKADLMDGLLRQSPTPRCDTPDAAIPDVSQSELNDARNLLQNITSDDDNDDGLPMPDPRRVHEGWDRLPVYAEITQVDKSITDSAQPAGDTAQQYANDQLNIHQYLQRLATPAHSFVPDPEVDIGTPTSDLSDEPEDLAMPESLRETILIAPKVPTGGYLPVTPADAKRGYMPGDLNFAEALKEAHRQSTALFEKAEVVKQAEADREAARKKNRAETQQKEEAKKDAQESKTGDSEAETIIDSDEDRHHKPVGTGHECESPTKPRNSVQELADLLLPTLPPGPSTSSGVRGYTQYDKAIWDEIQKAAKKGSAMIRSQLRAPTPEPEPPAPDNETVSDGSSVVSEETGIGQVPDAYMPLGRSSASDLDRASAGPPSSTSASSSNLPPTSGYSRPLAPTSSSSSQPAPASATPRGPGPDYRITPARCSKYPSRPKDNLLFIPRKRPPPKSLKERFVSDPNYTGPGPAPMIAQPFDLHKDKYGNIISPTFVPSMIKNPDMKQPAAEELEEKAKTHNAENDADDESEEE